jgi:hypothetical protein
MKTHIRLSQKHFKCLINLSNVRFEVFTAVTMKNAVHLDVTSYGSCENQHFRGKYAHRIYSQLTSVASY